MNYIHLAQSFWRKHDKDPFSGNETLLFMRLVGLFSDAGDRNDWPETMRFMDGELCSKTGLSPNCMKKVREVLIERETIAFEPVGKGFRSGGIYRLIDPVKPKRTSNNDDLLSGERQKDDQKDSQNDYQNLTNSLNSIESKPTNPQTSKSIPADDEILEVEAEEVLGEPLADAPQTSTPGSAAPPSPELSEVDKAEFDSYLVKLQSDRRLIEGLSKLYTLRGKDALDWIERFVIAQWLANNLAERSNKDLITHCQNWINTQLENQKDREQRQQSRSQNRGPATRQSRTDAGNDLDQLAREFFGS